MDRSGWSEEQVGRVDAFLARFKPTDDAVASKYRFDREFLLDCLISDEEPIRRRALEQLQKLVGRPIEFDLTAPEAQRLAAVTRLRAQIGDPPATQAGPRKE